MTMRNIEGVVMREYEKQVNTQKGPATTYSLLMNTGQGEEWFSFGFTKPDVTANQQVKFVVKQNGNFWNADSNTLETIKTSEAASPKVMAKAVAKVDNRQRSIVLQSATERAIMIINGAIQNDFITIAGKKSDKFDVYVKLISDEALRLAALFIDPPAEFAVADVDAKDVSEVVSDVDANGYSVV